MYLERLTLINVRTFRHLDLSMAPGMYVVTGPNASGKSNLVEAVTMLATARSARADSDVDLIAWDALEGDPIPAARLSAEVATANGPLTLDVVASVREPRGEAAPRATRRFRVNGVARRASDLIGQLRVVGFSANDLRLIDGPPAGRRRYLDITISQLDAAYVRALQRYQRVLQQRNSLLRRIQDRRARADELEFWDGELATSGSYILATRAGVVDELSERAREQYAKLAPQDEALTLCYRAAVSEDVQSAIRGPDLETRLADALVEERPRDIAAGVTRRGPHRDDIVFQLNGRDAGTFSSRGQQRSIALALRLAEVELSTERTGDPPVLLLDDVLSELDEQRRERVLATAHTVQQVVITSADEDRPARDDLPDARRYRIVDGRLDEVS